jgi:hypothetical protein
MRGSRFALTAAAVGMALTFACSRQSPSPASPSSNAAANDDASQDGSTLKVSAPTPTSPINDAQAADTQPMLTASASTPKFDPSLGPLQYRFEVYGDTGAKVQDSGLMSSAAFRVTATLSFKKRQTWRVRAEYQGLIGPWSPMASFISAEGGYLRGNEAFDPLFNGQTVGERIGATTFIPDQGIRLENDHSYVRYTIPQTINAGEFSVEVLGLRANGPGGKNKVMAMSSDNADFTTDPYRVDIQYRGVGGSPPNAITFRCLYGSADDLDVRYEPDTTTRFNSTLTLNPSTVYYWKWTWGGSEVRLTVQEGGANANGRVLYNVGVKSTRGSYNPRPHYVYLGAPIGRSGEDASIPQTIYRNVWIGARPRPL